MKWRLFMYLLLLPCLAGAAPARQEWRTITQSDGSRMEVMLVGDASLHYYITRDNRRVMPDKKGDFRPIAAERMALMERRGALRRNSQTQQQQKVLQRQDALHATSYSGSRRQLIILVDFTNMSFQAADPLGFWEKVYNQKGFQEDRFVGSVHDYFYDQSYGKLDLQFDLYTAHVDNTYQYYGGEDANGSDEKVGELVRSVTAQLSAIVPDWSVYDWNGDHEIEQVFVLFAGKGQNDGGADDTIWPHQWTLGSQGLTLTVGDGYKVDNYGCFAELDGRGNYGTFGVLCHEYSHCLGLPDLYQTVSPWGKILGKWDVMDYGLYNQDGFCPAGYSATERMMLGWLGVETLAEPTTVTGMTPLNQSGAKAYRVVADHHTDEYFVIEHRQQTGWDRYLPSSGVIITHIDYKLSIWNDNTLNNNNSHRRWAIVPANNNSNVNSQAQWAYPYEENDSLTNLSLPAATLFNADANGSTLLNKPITHIAVSDGVASFQFMQTTTAIGRVPRVQPAAEPRRYYDLRGRMLGSDFDALPPGVYIAKGDGDVRKVVKH